MLAASATEHLQRARNAGDIGAQFVDHTLGHVSGSARTVIPVAFQGARLHLLEAEGQGALDGTALDSLASQEQGAGAGGAIVVDVDDRDTAHTHFVQGSLTAGGVAIDVAGVSLLYQVVVQTGIFQGQANGLGAHFDIGAAGARLDELDHADAGNIGFLRHLCFSCERCLTAWGFRCRAIRVGHAWLGSSVSVSPALPHAVRQVGCDEGGQATPRLWPSQNGLRSSVLSTLPTLVSGSESRNSTLRGTL
ncbi:hypothetical protein D3C76_1081300 [compost metagenome]